MWEKEIGIFPVAWSGQSDEWVFHLSRALGGQNRWFGALPGEGDPAGHEVILKPPSGSSIRCCMRVRPDAGGIACVAFDDEAPVSEDDAEQWRAAAEAATVAMGRSDQDFDWRAILGSHPSAPEWHRPSPLAEPAMIGPLLLTPGGIQMRELTGYSRGRIERPWPARYTWPVIASGTVHTYSPDFAQYSARGLAHRVCALVSVILGTCWIPRDPDVQIPGWPEQGLSGVPQSVGPWDSTQFPDESLPADFNVYTGDDSLVLPAWTPRAWDLIEQDATVRTAVHGCYEALSLEIEHPSAAFLVYVATIEGIGARLVDLKRCKECGSQTGARRRFREALKTVLPADEAKMLANVAYDTRSKTGHEGQLFGSEQTFGYSKFSLFQFDDADVFDYALLWPMRKACRELIGNMLRGAPSLAKAMAPVANAPT